jgi:hypothetical protein
MLRLAHARRFNLEADASFSANRQCLPLVKTNVLVPVLVLTVVTCVTWPGNASDIWLGNDCTIWPGSGRAT